jgi:hypothetical protein
MPSPRSKVTLPYPEPAEGVEGALSGFWHPPNIIGSRTESISPHPRMVKNSLNDRFFFIQKNSFKKIRV